MKAGSAKVYAIEVNPKAKCYEGLEGVLNALKGYSFLAWIIHDKDTDENGEMKLRHFHIVIEYPTPKEPAVVDDLFEGGHVEKGASLSALVAYLTHETWTARQEGKHLYDRSSVHTNDQAKYNRLATEGSKEPYDPFLIPQYVAESCISAMDFMKRFGYDCYKTDFKYFDALSKTFKANEFRTEEERRKDDFIRDVHFILSKPYDGSDDFFSKQYGEIVKAMRNAGL